MGMDALPPPYKAAKSARPQKPDLPMLKGFQEIQCAPSRYRHSSPRLEIARVWSNCAPFRLQGDSIDPPLNITIPQIMQPRQGFAHIKRPSIGMSRTCPENLCRGSRARPQDRV